MSPLRILYDEQADMLTVEGVQYEGELFRRAPDVMIPRTLLSIDRSSDGRLAVSLVYTLPETSRSRRSVAHAGDGQARLTPQS